MFLIKKKLSRILSPELKQYIIYIYQSLYRIVRFQSKIRTKLSIARIGENTSHYYFGYYDLSPFGNKNDLIIYLNLDTDKNYANVMLSDNKNNRVEILTTTKAWNWQQGSRLRWLPGKTDCIIFNDFLDNKYCSRIFDISTKQEKLIPYPLYDISNDGKFAVTLDFARLGVKRPGYGYTNYPYIVSPSLGEEGIDMVNLETTEIKRIITYRDICRVLNIEVIDLNNNYINHLSISPSSNKFLFFWLTIVGTFHKAYLLVYDFDSQKIIPLETEGKVSHYLWISDEEILCTVYDFRGNCRYVKYRMNGEKVHCLKDLSFDGHPILAGKDKIITDSYPDKWGYQHLIMCDMKTEKIQVICDIYSKPSLSVEQRTDLHPRYHKESDTICIDANVNGYRNLYFLKYDNSHSNCRL